MPPVDFSARVQINGETYRARRLDQGPNGSASFIPQIASSGNAMSSFRTTSRALQLDPINDTDWSDGRGWGQNVDGSDGMLLPGPLVTSVNLPFGPGTGDLEQFAEQDGHIYVVGGTWAFKIANGSGAVTGDQNLGGGFVAVSIRPWKSSLIVGGRTSGNIWELPSGGVWTNTMVGAAVQRGKMTTVWWNTDGLSSLRLVSEVAPTTLSYVASNPRLDTDWKAALNLGAFPIRSMVGSRFHAYAATTGGLFDFGSDGTAPNLTPQVEHMVMDSNGRASMAAEGWIYYNAGYTLFRVRAVGQEYATVQDCGWAAQLPLQCPMSGYCTAIVRYGRWIWAFIYDGTNTWGIKGREAASADRFGPIVWYVAPIYLAGLKVTAAHVSGLVSLNPRLWMGVTDGSTRSLRWAHLALDSAYRDLRQARLYRFASSYTYDLPDEDHGDDSLPKLYSETVAENENCGTGATIALSLASDGSASYTGIGTIRSNPTGTVAPSTVTRYRRHIMRLTGTGTSSTPPVLKRLTRRAFMRPDLTEVRQYQVVIGHAVRHAGGSVDGRDTATSRDRLKKLQTANFVSFVDEHQRTLTALVSGGAQFNEMDANYGDEGAARVLVADIQMAVFGGAAGQTARYGTGVRYGTGYVYA